MFSSNSGAAGTLKDNHGRYFSDRNGDWFAVILGYLRGEPLQLPSSAGQRQALLAEARFFKIIKVPS